MSFRRDFVSLFFSTLRSERERADIEQPALVVPPRRQTTFRILRRSHRSTHPHIACHAAANFSLQCYTRTRLIVITRVRAAVSPRSNRTSMPSVRRAGARRRRVPLNARCTRAFWPGCVTPVATVGQRLERIQETSRGRFEIAVVASFQQFLQRRHERMPFERQFVRGRAVVFISAQEFAWFETERRFGRRRPTREVGHSW